MVSRETMRAHAERTTALLGFHAMLAAAGKQTIYDFTPEERARLIHPAYVNSGYFVYDTNRLTRAGLLPEKGTRHWRAVGRLISGIEELIEQGVDALQLTRRQLARQLGRDPVLRMLSKTLREK